MKLKAILLTIATGATIAMIAIAAIGADQAASKRPTTQERTKQREVVFQMSRKVGRLSADDLSAIQKILAKYPDASKPAPAEKPAAKPSPAKKK